MSHDRYPAPPPMRPGQDPSVPDSFSQRMDRLAIDSAPDVGPPQGYGRSQGYGQQQAYGPSQTQTHLPPRPQGHGQSYGQVEAYGPPSTSHQTQGQGQEYGSPQYQGPAQPQGPIIPSRGPYAPSMAMSQRTNRSTLGETRKLTSFFVRPGYGQRGEPVPILSNFFAVRTWGGPPNRAKVIYHYDVDINAVVKALGQKKPKGLLRAVWEQTALEAKGEFVKPFQTCAFDGRRNALTPYPFPIPEGEAQAIITAITPEGVVKRPSTNTDSSDDENKRFKVVIKLVATVDLEAVMEYCRATEGNSNPQNYGWNEEKFLTALMATNVLLRDAPSKRYAQVGATGNRFFTLDKAAPIPQGGVVCRGFMQSFRHSSSGQPLLNIDVAFSAFLAAGPALEVIAKILNRAGGRGGPGNRNNGGYGGGIQNQDPVAALHVLEDREFTIIKHKLRGAKFTVTHRQSSRLHTVGSVTKFPACEIFFEQQDPNGGPDKKVSVIEYFKSHYGVEVTRPRLPCLQYGKKNFVPLEFCRLVEWNSLPPPKLTAEQTAAMIKVAAVRPGDRAKMILDWRRELDHDNQPKIRAWGLQVNQQMIKLTGRILPPPQVLYGGGRRAALSNGSWNLRDSRFFAPGKVPLRAWSVVSFDRFCDKDDMMRYIDFMIRTMQRHGIQVDNVTPPLLGPCDPREYVDLTASLQMAAREAYLHGRGTQPQLICVILPGRDAHVYESIKRISFTKLKQPVPTQCMQVTKIREPRGMDAYTGNLVMKIQSKLGGVTHHIPLEELPGMVRGKTMLLGADLGHPPIKPGIDGAPTVACSIATYNADCSLYSAQIRLQEGRDEIVRDFSTMIEEHLKLFFKTNNSYPERILIFRDGVSEGQYAAALTYEHEAVLSAAQRLQPDYRPKILLCICAKRHNTRFFSTGTKEDASGNLPSGLVVDRSVTHPYAYDFFLQAHQGRVGTARPTHYICLLDELGLTPDQLQQLVHSLCYGFARCTKSVSLVPVCYIADLVCQKARIIVHDPLREPTIAPSESSAGRSNKSKVYEPNPNLDIMQMQKILAKNPDLSDVMWWM